MKLYSTNHISPDVDLKEAVFRGLPQDNGLYMPYDIPKLPDSFFENIEKLSLQEIAFTVAKALINDVPEDRLKTIVYDTLTFEVPVVNVHDNIYSLELIHGPSHAFKDFGARFMARLVSYFLEEDKREINILVATSGDTGSAVAQGFYGAKGVKVTILYPSGKVSDIQERQLTTLDKNITALEIIGNFDDCQRLVKTAFLDKEVTSKVNLSSANSINIARLIPQSFYYFYAYAKLKHLGKPLVFSVPSGNYGNLCGGLIAQKMGLPVHGFIASTNANDVVPRYLASGLYEPKSSVTTISNAMDVGSPNNFPRLQEMHGKSFETMKHNITGKRYSDAETTETVNNVHAKYNYAMCPHTAIAYRGLAEYLNNQSKELTGVFLATAHPAKFLDVIDTKVADSVIMPENLKRVMEKEKVSILLSNNYQELKDFLLK
ncbi:MAG: threonine synthase [Opitutaceae bacterium]|nr:threonine synthase [Cytophagales bacterium]